jgi:hypothetical protein
VTISTGSETVDPPAGSEDSNSVWATATLVPNCSPMIDAGMTTTTAAARRDGVRRSSVHSTDDNTE